MKPYIITYHWKPGLQDRLRAFFNLVPQIKNWVILNECSFIVTSVADESFLANRIREKFSGVMFIVAEINRSANGWEPQEIWKHISTPFSSGIWPDEPPLSLGISATPPPLQKAVWQKGKLIEGFSADTWRWDAKGQVMKFSEHGNRNSEHGWEIEYIIPLDKGGTHALENLIPLNWKTNQAKGSEILAP